MFKCPNVIDVHIQVDRKENMDLPFIVIWNQQIWMLHITVVNRNTRWAKAGCPDELYDGFDTM